MKQSTNRIITAAPAVPSAAIEPITASIVPTRAAQWGEGDHHHGEKAVEGVTGIGAALIVAIILVVVAVVWAGLRLVGAMIGGVINALGPATECGMEIETRRNAYMGQGETKCGAYVKAMNEVAAKPHTPCPSPGGSPPAACGLYAEYLRKIGCSPPTHCAGS